MRVCPRSVGAGRSLPRSRWPGGSRPIAVDSTSGWLSCSMSCRTPRPRSAVVRITEWRAMLLARETACLSREDRAEVDRRVAGDPDVLEGMGDGEIVARAREAAYELDPVSFVERRRRAEGDRRVSLRPAPDVMSQLSALLPVKDGVAVWAVLGREADQARAAGDQRSRGQIMADTLVRRVLSPGEGAPSVPLMINVVVPDSVLLGDDDGFGWVQHYGPVPGDLLREWIAANAEQGVDQWVRRLYASPKTGELVSMDSKSRRFEGALADYLRLRDQKCRTRYCDAPVRHLDHAKAHADGGPTSAANGQGLCEHCNYAKAALGWSARPRPGPRHTIETVTPTGHRYTSTAPPMTVAERGLLDRAGRVRAHGLVRHEHQQRDVGRAVGVEVEVEWRAWLERSRPARVGAASGTQTTLVE